ncbi:branched-chain amino acid ABC transporter permease [Nitriliruptor alkaliphilus]|uniref:branched-chain amino acid ABC transporter permease n=1 Tax=Nitriliruptor alkaliphilus TaxID=427918 RepID=UPI000696C9C5|nr:branched-chain amino acid ABC transporter permease [Nitriliruptor alkaliphilus]
MSNVSSRSSAALKALSVLFLLALVAAVPLTLSGFHTGVATRIAIFALFGIAFNIVFGAGGMPSLGHAAFFGVGGYLVAIGTLRYDLGFVSVFVLALLLGGLLGALVGALTLRTNAVYLLLLTLAVGQAVWGLAFQQVRWTGGDNGLAGISRDLLPIGGANAATFYWAVLAIVTVFGTLVWWFQRSPAGVAIVAHRESPSRLAALGYRVGSYRIAAFAVSGAVAAIAGVLYALLNRFVGPENVAWQTSAEVMVFAIAGGATYFAGPIVGALLLVSLETWVSGFTNRWLTILGLTYIFTMLFLPQGVLGLVDDLVRRRRSRQRDAERLLVAAAPPGPQVHNEEVPS